MYNMQDVAFQMREALKKKKVLSIGFYLGDSNSFDKILKNQEKASNKIFYPDMSSLRARDVAYETINTLFPGGVKNIALPFILTFDFSDRNHFVIRLCTSRNTTKIDIQKNDSDDFEELLNDIMTILDCNFDGIVDIIM